MSGFPERVAAVGKVGVHAARTVRHGDARFTACGITVDRRDMTLDAATEVTCWGCRRWMERGEGGK
jgi:hypothetical protein